MAARGGKSLTAKEGCPSEKLTSRRSDAAHGGAAVLQPVLRACAEPRCRSGKEARVRGGVCGPAAHCAVLRHPGGSAAAPQTAVYAAAATIIWVLANVLFFDNAFGRGFTAHATLEAVNLEPLRTIRNYLLAYGYGNISLRLVILNLAGNLIAFAPMGVFLPLYSAGSRHLLLHRDADARHHGGRVARVSRAPARATSTTSSPNLAGALIVYIICRVTPLWKRICSVTPRPKKE
ncbi:MAG: VanZ family protein [Butyricicoccaceae bacterium]